MLKPVGKSAAKALRDDLESDLNDVVAQAMRAWLKDVRESVLAALGDHPGTVLLAAGTHHDLPGMGTVARWWADVVDAAVVEAVRAAVVRAFARWSDKGIASIPSAEASAQYLQRVRDRLVLGMHFGVPIYQGAYDQIRATLAASQLEGWTRNQLATRIAKELSWEKDGAYWRAELSRVDNQIDSILDKLGPPGAPAREHARLNDPTVQALRDQRNIAVKHLDAEASVWQTRAMLIARTESTGAGNFGALQALLSEGVASKEWVATNDNRTRETHADADGQVVPLDGKFLVGTSRMVMPGDPDAPVEEVANCRCTIIAGDVPDGLSLPLGE